jgi:TPR repeat protein
MRAIDPALPEPELPSEPGPGTPLSAGTSRLIVVGLFAAFFSFLLWGRVQATPGLWGAFLIAGLGLGGWILVLLRRAKAEGRTLSIEGKPRKHHIVQIGVQAALYAYWGYYWDPVYGQLPLIVAQVIFAYLFDLALSWQRYGNYRFGVGPWPVVFSTNLFLWFRDPIFGAQFLMIATMFLAKEFLKWERHGKRVHIFNPSAFGLTLAALVLIATQSVHLSWGEQISQSLGYGPLSFEVMFIMSAVSQLFFGVAVVPMAAALTLVGLGYLYFTVTGVWFFIDTSIPIAVFLSLNLLITDPISSPYSTGGKAIFGFLYGVGVMLLFIGLRLIETVPTDADPGLTAAFFDKLLHVPLLNLMARGIDRIGPKIPLEKLTGSLMGFKERAVHVATWAAIFIAIRPGLIDHPGQSAELWRNACEANKPWACDNLMRVLAAPCEQGTLGACHDLGVVYDEGQAVPRDPAIARGLWQRACQSGHAESCLRLGLHLMADEASQAPELTRAAHAFNAACALKTARGCTQAGILRTEGRGPADASAATAHFTQGCDLGDGLGCAILGTQALRGATADPGKAVTRFTQACTLGHLPGCAQQADMLRLMRMPKLAEAAALYRRACDGDFAPACLDLAELTAAGQGVALDAEAATALRAKACTLGLKAACP